MLKLMVAEDEYIERKSLCFLVNQYFGNDLQLVADVSNGIDVLQQVSLNRPDIILMDIQMPKMDGLQAAEIIKHQFPEIEIVILTAFGDFKFAQTAVRLGIGDYLVKPFTDEEFCDSLTKIIKKKTANNLLLKEMQKHRYSMQKLVVLVEKEIILELARGAVLSKEQLTQYLQLLGIQEDKYKCLIFHLSAESELDEVLINYVKERLILSFGGVIGYCFFNDLIFFLFDNRLSDQLGDSSEKRLFQELNQALIDKTGFKVLCTQSDVKNELTDFKESYLQARRILESEEKNKKKGFANSYEKEIRICEKIVNEDLSGALILYEELLDEIGIADSETPVESIRKYLQQLNTVILRNVTRFFNNKIQLPDVTSVYDQLERINHWDALQFYEKNLIKRIIEEIFIHKESRNQKIVNVVKEYIEKNFSEDITLNQLAEFVGFSPFYLSKTFKRIEGISYKDYFIRVRMEKAKSIMRENKKTIQEIAYEVGYSDPNYFSKAFKKYAGISPTEFVDR